MPVVQEEIIEALREAHDALTMTDLVELMRQRGTAPSTMTIRAAVLPLITLRHIELTAERKLRLKA